MTWPGNIPHPAFRKLVANLLVIQAGFLLAPAAEPQALSKSMRFRRLSIEEGLSQATGQAILQDNMGFMWFGTQGGLNRYDGHTFTLYKHDSHEPTSLAHNHVWALCDDDSGNLWIGTDGGGLDRWDRRADTFIHHRHDPEDPASLSGDRVRALLLDSSGTLWVGTAAAGLSRHDSVTGTFSRIRSGPVAPKGGKRNTDPTTLSDDRIRALYEDHSGILWIGTRGGLNRLDRATRQIVRYTHDPSDPSSLSDNHVYAIHQDAGGNLWVGTDGGLNRLERGSGSFARYANDPLLPSSLSDNRVRAILEDRDGRLWIATDGGLNLFDRDAETFVRYVHEPANSASLSHDSILSLYQDASGVLWVGTIGGGLNRWNPVTWSFPHYQSRPREPHGLSNDIVTAFSEDAVGDLWIGTFGSGLNRWQRDSGNITYYRNDPANPSSLSDDRVMALVHDRLGQLWVGTRNSGLDRLDSQNGNFTHYAHDPRERDSLSNDLIMSLFEDRYGTLWIGTSGGGLDRFDRNSERFVAFRHDPGDPTSLSDDRVSCITEDPAGRLWVGTLGGLNRFAADRERRSFEHYRHQADNPRSLASDDVMSLHVDSSGILWVGTKAGGLDRLDDLTGQPAEAAFRNYSERDGLPNATVYGIRSDGEGRLWLSTNDGLARFDPRSETFDNYDMSHGLQNDEFFFGAHYRSPGGEMFFGGISGFNAFFPERIERDAYVPPVVITGFLKRNKPVDLDRPIYDARELELSYRDSVFSFEFAALDYRAPERNRYAYTLEGFDEDWIDLGQRRPVTYTNLGPGDYVFRVKASGADGVWNEQGAAMAIHIVPSPWKTWWAYAGYALVATALAYGGLQWRLRGLRRRGEELASTVKQRTAELSLTVDRLRVSEQAALEAKEGALKAREEALEERRKALAASRAKSSFLSHMSHELRTPLNAVLGFARLMERDRDLSGEHRENLAIIRRSGEHLLGLIDDVLSFSKIEAGKLTLNKRSFDLRRLLLEIEGMIRLRAEARGLALDFDLDPDIAGSVLGDDNKLRQVLLNLLGNAVKFTDRGGVGLRARWRDEIADFEISDSGRGIAEKELKRLFEPFEQTGSGQYSIGGTGLGLAISRKLVRVMGGELEVTSAVGEGSVFRFAIRLSAGGEAGLPAEPRRVLRLAPDQPPLRVLVADDAEDNRILLRRLLGRVGFEVREAADGGEALDTWASWRPHLIWMDMRMPVMDGYEATRRLRRAESKRAGDRTAVIALTATAFEHDRRQILAAGCDEMVTKPFREATIFDKLAEYLEARFVYEEARPVGAGHDESPQPAAFGTAATAAGRATASLIDFERLAELRELEAREPEGGLVSRLIGSFLEASPPWLAEIRRAVAARDAPLLRDAAHGLKGSSSNVGAVRVTAVCVDLERLGMERALDKPGGAAAAEVALAKLDFELERAIKALEAERDSA